MEHFRVNFSWFNACHVVFIHHVVYTPATQSRGGGEKTRPCLLQPSDGDVPGLPSKTVKAVNDRVSIQEDPLN